MKSKTVFGVAFLIAGLICLGAAMPAHAYAIYNHVDHEVCVAIGAGGCNFYVGSHDHHNGEHGSGLRDAAVFWNTSGGLCMGSGRFDIPKGGFIRIYKHEVKIYNHHNKHLRSKGIHRTECPSYYHLL
ncbi:MAG: potassium-transporting ATPase subunit KdpA [Desulfarculaceae bacterium]|nr:potassium-transporting ATPase subunit KdpA [Desulfarculaceae bacterium]